MLRGGVVALDETRLATLRSDVDAALDEAEACDDLDPTTRKFVIRQLLRVKRALDDYVFLGISVVEDAANETLGAIARHGEYFSGIRNSKIAGLMSAVIIGLDLILNLAANGLAIGSAIHEPPAPSPAVVQILELPPGPNVLPPERNDHLLE